MLTNLFSMFDPTIYMLNPFLMMYMIMCFMLMKKTKLLFTKPKMMLMFLMMNKFLKMEFNSLLTYMENKKSGIKNMGIMKFVMHLFTMIFIVNFLSLYPYIFSMTSHMSVNMTLSVILWMVSVMMAFKSNYKMFLSHLTPSGTPLALMSFMVLIETISNIIRPLTLAVRLMANMVAGHLLLSLLSGFSLMSINNSFTSSLFMMILGILEMGVSLIQAYVMTLLFSLYLKEAF